MKKAENNEIDLLLRSFAKRRKSPGVPGPADAEAPASENHLDADELNSFAEGVVPAAARARYTAHLVDCSRCRRIVTQLTASSGLPVSATLPNVQTEKTLWQRIGALLSPPVLRYAVPALALLAVITVSLIFVRQQGRTNLVARNEGNASQAVSQPQPDTLDKVETRARTITATPEVKPAQNSATTLDGQSTRTSDTAGEKAGAGAGTSGGSVSNVASTNSPKPAVAAESQTVFAPDPPTAPPAAARPQPKTGSDDKKDEAVAKQKVQADGVVARDTRNEVAEEKEQEKEVADLSRSRKAAAAGRGGGGLRMEARREESAQSRRADEDSETRAVNGRRFRKQGNTWIDTAYEASRPAITIIRGSEQYRALVADEPGIHSIAEKLSGEVIIVWKGRAYRIR